MDVTLQDKYNPACKHVFLSGVQAAVRAMIVRQSLDAKAGWNTGGFVSGYRGSPLGRIDTEFWAARALLDKHQIRFQPGVNEELAATSVWGTQQIGLMGKAKVDGVFGLWYGKGPGVDRSGDAFKHANMAGTSAHGGVVALVGDDHAAKSSTIAHQSEQAFAASMMPVLVPANVQEVHDYCLLGWEMSRASGCWVGVKVTSQIADASETIYTGDYAGHAGLADTPHDLGIRWPENKNAMEERLVDEKLAAAQVFARSRGINRTVVDAPNAKLGIVTVGKAHRDFLAAINKIGLSENNLKEQGIRVHKIGMSWPIDPKTTLDALRGLEKVLVIEEKRAFVESQIAELLYKARVDAPPVLIGKRTAAGDVLLPAYGELTPKLVEHAVSNLLRLNLQVQETIGDFPELPLLQTRKEFFCAGCPHNRSTRVPEGSIALAGIGCHTMASRMPDRNTITVCQMGGEGATWIGQAPFVERQHVFQNIGDGTYFHSGFLAIRAAIAAKVNITYKLLYNDAVAMTGGQPVDGTLTVEQICHELLAEGASQVVIVTENSLEPRDGLENVQIFPRTEMDGVQRELREKSGVSIIIYEQVCAAEKRRRRKRGKMPEPPKRLFINERVCEGCGDCVEKSSCIALPPTETIFGSKRRIDQSACNKDFSCSEGFCPSFVELSGATPHKTDTSNILEIIATQEIPEPLLPSLDTPKRLLVTGIGGTGVVTIGSVLGMAAHLDGHGSSVLDMTGLAQKNGAVTSHITIAKNPASIDVVKINQESAHLLLACDMATAASNECLAILKKGQTSAVLNSDVTVTAGISFNRQEQMDPALLRRRIADVTGEEAMSALAASSTSQTLLGDPVFSNMMMLGFAWQKGMVPVSLKSLKGAIRLNAAAIQMNLASLELGRRIAELGPESIEGMRTSSKHPNKDDMSTKELVSYLSDELIAYQNTEYALRYSARITAIKAAEKTIEGDLDITRVIAIHLYRLMAIKDEYEIARLYSDGAFLNNVYKQFDNVDSIRFHMAPPFLAPKDKKTGLPKKIVLGSWLLPVLRVLAQFRALRGSWLDVFGMSVERRLERRLLADYENVVDMLATELSSTNRELALKLASYPAEIKGFGHIKLVNSITAGKSRNDLLDLWAKKSNGE